MNNGRIDDMVRIAVTGGPCAGKTTVMEAIKRQHGNQLLVMPEVASILLDHGFPKPGRDTEFDERWSKSFQCSVFPVQKNMETEYLAMARRRACKGVVFDRGILDGAAYLGKGLQFFLDLFGIDENEAYGYYTLVLHLESVAVSNPVLYEKLKSTNPARYESATEAAQRDLALRQVWQGHPNHVVIPSGGGIADVVERVLEEVSKYIDTEIECKYTLPGKPAFITDAGTFIRQGYFNTSGEMRIRQIGHHYMFAIKDGGTGRRRECERAIEPWAFEQQWPDTEGRRIEKTRHYVPYGDLTLEVDVYHGALEGLVTLECEFGTEEQLERFRLPDWAEGAIDVTDDKRYKNKSLALCGLPA